MILTKKRLINTLNLYKAVRLVWNSSPKNTLAGIGLIIIQGILPLLSLYLIKLIVDEVAVTIASSNNINEVVKKIGILIIFACFVALCNTLCQSISEINQQIQGENATDYISDLIHKKSVDVDISYYDQSSFYDTMYVAQQEAPYRSTHIVKGGTNLCSNCISLIAIGGFFFTFIG